MADYSVNSSVLNSTATEVRTASTEFMNFLGQLEQEVEKTKSYWESDSQIKFYQQYEKLKSDLNKFDTTTNAYAEALEEAARVYKEVDIKVGDDSQAVNADSLFNR